MSTAASQIKIALYVEKYYILEIKYHFGMISKHDVTFDYYDLHVSLSNPDLHTQVYKTFLELFLYQCCRIT